MRLSWIILFLIFPFFSISQDLSQSANWEMRALHLPVYQARLGDIPPSYGGRYALQFGRVLNNVFSVGLHASYLETRTTDETDILSYLKASYDRKKLKVFSQLRVGWEKKDRFSVSSSNNSPTIITNQGTDQGAKVELAVGFDWMLLEKFGLAGQMELGTLEPALGFAWKF